MTLSQHVTVGDLARYIAIC